MSEPQDHPFRPPVPPPRVLKTSLAGRTRIVDSVLIPFVPLIGACLAGAFVARPVSGVLAVSAVALFVGAAIMLARMRRPCVLTLEWPYRTLRWTHPSLPAPREVDLDEVTGIETDVENVSDTAIVLLAFALRDGTRVRLFDDTNLAFGDGDARRLRARIEGFLEGARRASRGGARGEAA